MGTLQELGGEEVGLGSGDRPRTGEWRCWGPGSELRGGFFALGLSHLNRRGAGEGVSSPLLKMCKQRPVLGLRQKARHCPRALCLWDSLEDSPLL